MYTQRIRDNSSSEIGLAVFYLIFLTALAMVVHRCFRSADITFFIVTHAPFFALPPLALWLLIHRIRRRKKFGTAILILDSTSLHLGEKVIGSVETSLPVPTFETIRLRVWSVELTSSGRYYEERVRWQQGWLIPKSQTQLSTRSTIIPVRFPLPYAGKPTNGLWGPWWKVSVET
ncbi:MAG TPA: hypothetical protein VMB21_14455 [Candidatus Limnocylindria bacterium]|nr:hypothetical protein [Candidatus Limnocylindria bacterium]